MRRLSTLVYSFTQDLCSYSRLTSYYLLPELAIFISSWRSKAEEANEAFEPEVELREVSTNNTLVNSATPSSLTNLPPNVVEKLRGVHASVDSAFLIYDAARTTLLDARTNYEHAKDSFKTARGDYLDRRYTQKTLLRTLCYNERDSTVVLALFAHTDEMSIQHRDRTNHGRDGNLVAPHTWVDTIMFLLLAAASAFLVVWIMLGNWWAEGHCRTSLTWTFARNNIWMAVLVTLPFFLINMILASPTISKSLQKHTFRRIALALILSLLTVFYIAFVAMFMDGHGDIQISPDCSANPLRHQHADYSVRRLPGQRGFWDWLEHARSNESLDETMRAHIAAYDASEIAQNLTAHYRTLMWNINY